MSSRGSREDDAVELAALADGTLDPVRRAELEERILQSPELAELLAEQERAVTMLRGAADEVAAPVALRMRVEDLRAPRRRARPSRLVWVGAAATAAAAALLAVIVFTGSGSPATFSSELESTGALGAAGTATFTNTGSGWRIELDATGLPRLDGGRFYEAWLKNDDGVLVPVGTFNEGEDVTLWAGVSPKDFTTLSVTREPADGDQASSGDKVLAGTIESTD